MVRGVGPRIDARAYGQLGKKMRWRIVQLYIDHDWSSRRIAQYLSFGSDDILVAHTTVCEIVKIFRLTGDVRAPCAGRRRRPGIVSARDWDYLVTVLEARPDVFLDEMQALLAAWSGTRYAISTLCVTLRRNDYTRRVLHRIARRRDLAEEVNWIGVFGKYPANFFVFIDETRKDPRGLCRRYGRGIRGERTVVLDMFSRSKSYSALAVLTLDGVIDCVVDDVKGVNAERLIYNIFFHLVPHLRPFPGRNSIVMLDNASIHHDPRVRQMIEATGARIVFIPPYANNLNPIEEGFSKAKLWLQRHRDMAERHPVWALATALRSVTHTDAAGYMRHAGYNVRELVPGILYA